MEKKLINKRQRDISLWLRLLHPALLIINRQRDISQGIHPTERQQN